MKQAAVALAALALLGASGAGAAPTGGAGVKTAANAALNTTILVDVRGRTLYMYTADDAHASVCINDATFHCSKHWPPLLTAGKPHAGGAAKQSLLGTIKRADGKMQVTYGGHPLYTYALGIGGPADTKPGDVHGQSVVSSWWVLSAAGKAIKKQP